MDDGWVHAHNRKFISTRERASERFFIDSIHELRALCIARGGLRAFLELRKTLCLCMHANARERLCNDNREQCIRVGVYLYI